VQALEDGVVKPLAGHMTQQQQTWLEGHLTTGCKDYQALATFLIGISKAGYEYPEENYAALAFAQPVLPSPPPPLPVPKETLIPGL
jgi:hypothetical protein